MLIFSLITTTNMHISTRFDSSTILTFLNWPHNTNMILLKSNHAANIPLAKTRRKKQEKRYEYLNDVLKSFIAPTFLYRI